MRRIVQVWGFGAALAVSTGSALAQPTSSFPDESGPPPPPAQGAYGPRPTAQGQPVPHGSQPAPYTPQPLNPPGQVLGPYQRPEGAPMPGYGDMDRAAYVVTSRLSDYFHDGLYVRLAGGLGFASDSQSTDIPLPTVRQLRFQPGPYSGTASGMAPGTEVAIGFTPVGGLVVAFAIDTATVMGPTASVDDPRTGDYVFRTSQFALFNAMADFYFNRQLGFHAQAGLGLATYVSGVGDPLIAGPRAQAHTAVGFGFMLGGGYEWFVSRQWSLGVIARLLWGTTGGTDPRGAEWSHTTLVPGLMVAGTYH